MALTLETLPARLMSARLFTAEAIVNNRFEAHDLSRRNRVFRVQLGESNGLLIKQAGKENNHLGLHIEATALGLIGSRPAFRALKPWVPEVVHFDQGDWVVATRLLDPATSLLKLHMNGGEPDFPVAAAAVAGRILASLHSVPVEAVEGQAPNVPLRRGPIHNVNRPFHYGWGYSREEFAPALVEIFRHLDETMPRIHEKAERVSARWPAAAPMHGDIRWENFLIGPSGADGSPNVRLVDWEFFCIGDPAWDVACYLAEYLRFWSYTSFPANRGSPRERVYADTGVLVPCQPEAFHASARAFMETYRAEARLQPAAWEDLMRRVADYLPFTMLRIIGEQSAGQQALAVGPRLLLTMLADWLDRPEDMMRTFFGFRGDAA